MGNTWLGDPNSKDRLSSTLGTIGALPARLMGLVGLDTTSELSYKSTDELYKIGQQSSKDSARTVELMSQSQGVASSTFGLMDSRKQLLSGLGLSEDQEKKFADAARKAVSSAFSQGQSLFRDEKVNTTAMRENILKQAKASGMSETALKQLEARLSGDTGKEFISQSMRADITGYGDTFQAKRRRAQLNEHMQADGMDTKGLKDLFASSVKKDMQAFADKEGSPYSIYQDNVKISSTAMQLGKSISDTGASTEDEYKFSMEMMRRVAAGEPPQLVAEELLKRFKLPTDKAKSIIDKATQIAKNKGNTELFAGAPLHDTKSRDALASSLFKNRQMVQTATTVDNMRKRLADMGIKVDDGHLGKGLEKLSEDSDTMKQLLGKDATDEQRAIGKQLQRLREGSPEDKKSIMSDIMNQVMGNQSDTRSGVRTGSAPDAIARSQIEMAKQLHQFAIQNARNTSAFGQFVDSMVNGTSDFKKGAKDIKEAGEIISRSFGGAPKTKK